MMAERGKVNLDGMTVPELQELAQAIQAKIEEIRTEARTTMRAKLEELAASAGLSLEEVIGAGTSGKNDRKAPRKSAGKAVAIKYRGPNGDTWSGRGRPPKWLAVLEAEGKSRDDYRV